MYKIILENPCKYLQNSQLTCPTLPLLTHPPPVRYLPAVPGPGADPIVSDLCRHVATSHRFPPLSPQINNI